MVSRLDQLRVGQTVDVTLFGGCRMWLVITAIEEDIKDGRPGIDGYNAHDATDTRWCYLDQISRVVKDAPK